MVPWKCGGTFCSGTRVVSKSPEQRMCYCSLQTLTKEMLCVPGNCHQFMKQEISWSCRNVTEEVLQEGMLSPGKQCILQCQQWQGLLGRALRKCLKDIILWGICQAWWAEWARVCKFDHLTSRCSGKCWQSRKNDPQNGTYGRWWRKVRMSHA